MPIPSRSPFTEYWSKGFPAPLNKMELRTSGTIKAELFGSIEMYSEVKVYGKELLRAKGHTNPAKAFANFQAYIRQGKTFYQAGDALHHRASPLLYYYAFMNFGKALALLRDPNFIDNSLMHGLEYRFEPGRLRRQFLRVRQYGVFPLVYSAVTGTALQQNAKLKILDLFGYDTDVGFEYTSLKFGQSRSLPVWFLVVKNLPTRTAHALIAVGRGHAPKSFAEVNSRALKGFTEVSVPPMDAKNLFNIRPEDHNGYGFFESSKKQSISVGDWYLRVVADAVENFGSWIQFDPANLDFLFRLNSPIRTPNIAPMSEFLAIYCLAFYLGSLVRYRPQYLESLLATKDAWIVERFLYQAPITFLRHFRNAIDGRYIVMRSI